MVNGIMSSGLIRHMSRRLDNFIYLRCLTGTPTANRWRAPHQHAMLTSILCVA
jgi:hypothetical protein